MYHKTEQDIMQHWKGDLDTPLVSICTITYNHENFIVEALDSFLMQETDFPFELVIDDDHSPDGTADIIKQYMEKYPNIMNVNLREKNVGSMTNFMENMQRAKGKYIALCEGDDYWTDPLKLQKQVEFLEANPEYSLCYTAATLINDNNKVIQQNKSFGDSSEDELISGYGAAITGSMMFRKFTFDDYKQEDTKNGDALLWHYLGFYGKCKQLNNIKNTVYRIHNEGIWSGMSEENRLTNSLKTYSIIRNNIISKLKDNSILLDKHDQIYKTLFTQYFLKKIFKLDIEGCKFGLNELKKIKQLDLAHVCTLVLKTLFRQVAIYFYLLLRLDKLKRYIKSFM